MCSMIEYIEENMFDVIKNYDFSNLNSYLSCGRIIGLGASILNGYSYESLLGGITYYCPCKELDGVSDGVSRLIYLSGYPEIELGVDCDNFTNPERTICDFLMYPEELNADLFLYDLLEGYRDDEDTPDDWNRVYEMMKKLDIPKEKLDERLHDLEDMEY